MRLILGLNDRYCRTPDGQVWTDEATWSYALLRRYLDVYSSVVAVARVRPVAMAGHAAVRADGPGVEFADVPYFVGPLAYARRRRDVQRALRDVVRPGDAVLLRLPAWHLTAILSRRLPATDYPYGVEVCGDAAGQLAAGSIARPWRRWLGHSVARSSRGICQSATAALYVTHGHLQRLYPPRPDAYVAGGCTNADLPAAAFRERHREFCRPGTRRLIVVGSLATRVKGADVLIEAIARCRRGGLKVELTVVGDGRGLPDLRRQATRAGVADDVRFVGRVPGGAAVRQLLDEADLFVLPSRSEGLPRSLLEAMARGLPCVATSVGGIPELLGADVLVPPGCPRRLADKIRELCTDAYRLAALSMLNARIARQYETARIAERRNAFLTALRSRTESWLAARAAHDAGRKQRMNRGKAA